MVFYGLLLVLSVWVCSFSRCNCSVCGMCRFGWVVRVSVVCGLLWCRVILVCSRFRCIGLLLVSCL